MNLELRKESELELFWKYNIWELHIYVIVKTP